MKESVAAIFATMGRPDTADACVKALAGQTLLPAMLVVACNDPGDGTMESLRAMEPLPFRLVLHAMATNRGNAGGVEEAMALALRQGCGACWILDDDSWPEPDALGKLVAAMRDADDVAHPLQWDPLRNELAWPVVLMVDNGRRLHRSVSELPEGDIHLSGPAWTGAVVPRGLIERAGPVPGELFIRGEDEEYPDRLRAAGARFLFVPGARLLHPGPKDLREWRIAGKSMFWEPDLPEWKLYYKIRNFIWRRKNRDGFWHALLASLLCGICLIRHDHRPVKRLRIWLLATRHACSNHLGRLRAPWAP
jgi:GT2 family glycosyltransferase